MANQPYIQFLQENLNPLIRELDESRSILDDPFISQLRVEPIDGGDVGEQGYIDLWQSVSKPSVYMGDQWMYTFGDSKEKVGRIKTTKITIAVNLTKSEYKKIRESGFVSSKIKKKLKDQMRTDIMYGIMQVKKRFFNAFDTSSLYYDGDFVSPGKKSASDTLADPNDVNSNSALALTSIKWSGAQQSENNVQNFANQVKQTFVLIDSDTDIEIPVSTFTWIVSPEFYTILNSTKDILNSTTNQRSENTYITDLANAGITVIKDNQGASYTYSDGNTHTSMVYGDLPDAFQICPVKYKADDADDRWSEWREIPIQKGDLWTYMYEKHRDIEFTFMQDAYDISGTLYAKKLEVTTQPYDQT